MTDYKIVKAIRNGQEYQVDGGGGTPTIELLVVGGGGQGGGCCTYGGGGGGAGGVIQCDKYELECKSYNVVIGAGGTGDKLRGCPGDNTCFGQLIAYGGGQGTGLGQPGGSGGGAVQGEDASYGIGKGGANCIGQGHMGGGYTKPGYTNVTKGGGGGAGEDGYMGVSVCAIFNCSGKGGNGIQSCISGENCWYAGGGGGAYNGITNGGVRPYCGAGLGGCGGGGAGGTCCEKAEDATYYGGGGGGVGCFCCVCGGGSGYQGIVIARYKTDGSMGINCATGGCVYCCDGYTIHCFTSDGTFCVVS